MKLKVFDLLDELDIIAGTFGWMFSSSIMFFVLAIISLLSGFYTGFYSLSFYAVLQLVYAFKYKKTVERITYVEFAPKSKKGKGVEDESKNA